MIKLHYTKSESHQYRQSRTLNLTMEGKAKKDVAAVASSLGPARKESFMVVEEVIETKEMLAPLQDNDYE